MLLPIIERMKSFSQLLYIFLICFFVLFTASLGAQKLNADFSSPFVSHLNAQANKSEIILSWRDAPDLKEVVYEILRNDSEINSENIENATTVAVVAPDIETFTDRPPEGNPWWYAVVAVTNGIRYQMIIPWRNATGVPISISIGSEAADKAARVLALTAELDGQGVRLQYVADSDEANITVFRSPRSFDGPGEIDHAVTVGTRIGSSGALIDSPIPGVTWYYAAVDDELFRTGNPQWRDSAAFSNPVTPSLIDDETPSAAMRPAPLPRLRIMRSFADGRPIPEIDGELPERKKLTASVISALAEVLDPIQGELWEEPNPVILDLDRGHSDDRLQCLLMDILNGSFEERKWETAESELFALSASNGIDGAMKARIQFYRGQCQYYLGDLQSAFLSFLYASDHYYPESRKWMLTIYDDITPVS